MILKREQFMSAIGEYVGDDNSEQALQFIENVTDTFNDLEKRAVNGEDFVPKAELQKVNDEWAKKYKERFLQGTPQIIDSQTGNEPDDESEKPLLFENLFKEG